MATKANAWTLHDDDDHINVETVTRDTLREWLTDGTMTRDDVRRLYRNGQTVLSGTGGAIPQYSLHATSR